MLQLWNGYEQFANLGQIMIFSKSTTKLKLGAGMAVGQVGCESVFICDVLGTCGVNQGARMVITSFSVQESKFGRRPVAAADPG